MILFTSFCFSLFSGLQVTFSGFSSDCCYFCCHFPFVIVRGIIIRVHHCQIFVTVVVVDLPKQQALSIYFVVYFHSWSVNQIVAVAAANVFRVVGYLLLMPIFAKQHSQSACRCHKHDRFPTVTLDLTHKRSKYIVCVTIKSRAESNVAMATVSVCQTLLSYCVLRKNHRAKNLFTVRIKLKCVRPQSFHCPSIQFGLYYQNLYREKNSSAVFKFSAICMMCF